VYVICTTKPLIYHSMYIQYPCVVVLSSYVELYTRWLRRIAYNRTYSCIHYTHTVKYPILRTVAYAITTSELWLAMKGDIVTT